jgi:hypothetical protein
MTNLRMFLKEQKGLMQQNKNGELEMRKMFPRAIHSVALESF